MRCLLIGSGSIGRRHAAALRGLVPDAEIVALRSGVGGTLPPGTVNREIRGHAEAIKLDPDCAIIANPAPLHAESAAEFVRAGVPVLLEKPIATDAGGMRLLLEAAKNNPRVLCGYVLRHDPALAKFRQALRDGAVGRRVTLHLESGQALSDWRETDDPARSISARRETGGGVLFELSHEIDAARWLLGEVDPVQAMAATRGALPIEVEDTALVGLRAADGTLALAQIDMARRVALRRYRAVGTDATMEWIAAQGSVRIETGDETRVLCHEPCSRDELFRRQMRHFLDVAAGRSVPLCGLEDAAETLTAVLRARQLAGLGEEAA